MQQSIFKKTLFITLAALFVTSSIGVTLFSNHAGAVTGSDWRAGRIIDDVVFFNKSSMSAIEIQHFLNAKVPTCDRNRPSSTPSYQPPWTCLKEYQENTTTKENNVGRFNSNGTPYNVPGGRSAAQIIWDVSQQYGINPQVLIIMLQKEQSLITDNWPWKVQYDKAMGYACPDTAPCNEQYYGLYNQIDSAAWQIKRYGQYPDSYNFKAGATRYIGYSPIASCGGSNVYIENVATAALYNYTPYQPNAGALANLYGTADCGAYGNRNFWRMFNDWFGSTKGASFVAGFYKQSPYPTGLPGETKNAYIAYKNNGTVPWWDSREAKSRGQYPVHLATALPTNRISPFSATWTNGGRVSLQFTKVFEADGTTLASDQKVVLPGQIAWYDFKFTIPLDLNPKTYREGFLPVREGTSSWYMGGLSWLDIKVKKPNIKVSFAGQSNYPNLKAGESTDAHFDLKNTGNVALYDNAGAPKGIYPLHLATYNPINKVSKFASNWPNKSRPQIVFDRVVGSDGVTLTPNQHMLAPGQTARFSFNIKVPNNYVKGGKYREYFMPILEGAKNWNLNRILWQNITVLNTENKVKFVGQSKYPTISPGSSTMLHFKFKNVGNTEWYDGVTVPNGKYPLRLATFFPANRKSNFNLNWDKSSRPRLNFSAVYEPDGTTLSANQHTVLPGQIVKMDVPIDVPTNTAVGTYREYFTPAFEGSESWYTGIIAWQDIKVIN